MAARRDDNDVITAGEIHLADISGLAVIAALGNSAGRGGPARSGAGHPNDLVPAGLVSRAAAGDNSMCKFVTHLAQGCGGDA